MIALPNTYWQIHSGVGFCTKMNHQGTGNLPALAVSSYTTGSNTVTAFCSDTSQLKAGDLVLFDGADPLMQLCSMEVDSITPNVSFTGRLPLGLKPSISQACAARPIMIGDYDNPVSGAMADGWDKDASLGYWLEDNAVNCDVGFIRSAAFKKTSSGVQSFRHDVPAHQVHKWRGKAITFSIAGKGADWRVRIVDGGVDIANAPVSGAFQRRGVSANISNTCQSLSFVVDLLGEAGSVNYFCGPEPAKDGYLIPRVMILFQSFHNANATMTDALSGGGYGFRFNPYAESNGRITRDVRVINMTWEGRNASHNVAVALRSSASAPAIYSFIRYSDPKDAMICSSHLATIGDDGAYFYSENQGANLYNMSMEANGYVL